MSDDDKALVDAMTLSIKESIGKQFNATPIHPDPSIGDWAASGGVIDLRDVAEALLPIISDRIEQLEREKAVVSDLWEQQKEIALDYLADCNKAAARIEAQAAEIERLGSVIDATANHWLALQDKHPVQWEGAIDGAMAAACTEIEKLREALREIEAMTPVTCDMSVAHAMGDIAIEALGETK